MKKSPEVKKLMTVSEAAEYLRLKKSTVYNLVHTRRITYRKHGNRLIFTLGDLEKFSERQIFPADT